jgi:putative CRISPR-associated protein (TIGR02620 family)
LTNFFISRHPGAVDWAREQGLDVDVWLSHLDVDRVQPGDTVAGTLPIHLAAAVCDRGARYLHLSLDLPEAVRGNELDVAAMNTAGARLIAYDIRPHHDITTSPMTPPDCIHVCIATGQNAANLIPLEQLGATEVWILQTPAMRSGAAHLQTALKRDGRAIKRLDFDDSTPAAIERSAQAVAEQLDGRHVVLHATGGTKLMVLALRDGLRLVETGSGQLDILYAETHKQQIDWLGPQPRTDAMADVLDLRAMLLVQGYRIDGDNRHAEAQQRAQPRADITRDLGDNAARHARYLSALATLASRASEGQAERDLTQHLQFPPGGSFADLLRKAQAKGLLRWDGEDTITFTDHDNARYFAGAWLEEFVLLKLVGGLGRPGRFSSNLRIVSADNGVENEIDAMLVHRNRALLIECKTGRQTKAQDAIYKLAQLRTRLGGSVASGLYLSAQKVPEEVLQRAAEYQIDVLAEANVARLVPWLRDWQNR